MSGYLKVFEIMHRWHRILTVIAQSLSFVKPLTSVCHAANYVATSAEFQEWCKNEYCITTIQSFLWQRARGGEEGGGAIQSTNEPFCCFFVLRISCLITILRLKRK